MKPWPQRQQRNPSAEAFVVLPTRTERPLVRLRPTSRRNNITTNRRLNLILLGPTASAFPPSSSAVLPATTSAVSTLPALFPARPPQATAAAALFVVVFVSGILLGFALGKKKFQHRDSENDSMQENQQQQQHDEETASFTAFTSTATATPTWLNYALAQLWKLLAANTRQFVDQVVQPLLDEAVRENAMNNNDEDDNNNDSNDSSVLLERIRLTQYNLGARTAPTVDHLQAVPARSRDELQCQYRLRLRSTSALEFAVDVRLLPPAIARRVLVHHWWRGWFSKWWKWLLSKWLSWQKNTKRGSTEPRAASDNDSAADNDNNIHHNDNNNATVVTIPVSLSNLQIDAQLWSAFELRPFEPYCTAWRYAILEPPAVAFEMTVGNGTSLLTSLPVTSIPLLRSLFFRIIREEIPKDCLFPRSNTVNFLPKDMVKARQRILNANATATTLLLSSDKDNNSNGNNEREIRRAFPEQAALFDALDASGDGRLRPSELVRGLAHWGYTVHDAQAAFAKLGELQQQQQQQQQQVNNQTLPRTHNTTNNDNYITLADFCRLWPQVTADPIPSEYEGMLTVRLQNLTVTTATSTTTNDTAAATMSKNNVQSPVLQARLLGDGDPVDGGCVRPSKASENGDPAGGDDGSTLWIFGDDSDESSASNVQLELPCRPPILEKLELTLYDDAGGDDHDDKMKLPLPLMAREDSPNNNCTRTLIAQSTIPLKSLATESTAQQTLQVNMQPAGTISLNVAYAKFVDGWNICLDQEDATNIVGNSTNRTTTTTNLQTTVGGTHSNGNDNDRFSENHVSVAEDEAGKGTSV